MQFGPCGPGCNHGFGGMQYWPSQNSNEKHSPTIDDLMAARRFYDSLHEDFVRSEKDKKERDKAKEGPKRDTITVSEMWVYLIVGCLPMGWLLTTIGAYCIKGIQYNMQQLIAPH